MFVIAVMMASINALSRKGVWLSSRFLISVNPVPEGPVSV